MSRNTQARKPRGEQAARNQQPERKAPQAEKPSSEEIRQKGGLHEFDPVSQRANADRPDGNLREISRAKNDPNFELADAAVEDIADTDFSGMELGGQRSMRPNVQAGTDQGGTAAGRKWRGEGWTAEEHHPAMRQGREGQANQQGPTPISGQGSEVQDKNADRGKPGDRRHGERKYGT